jgi:MFS superfamily sulfate permease-like transporter
VIAGILVVTLFNLDARGVEIIGNVGTQIPTLKFPVFTLQDFATLLPGVIALSLIGYAESDAVAEQFAADHRYDIKPNQELVALGAANVASGLFQGFIVAGGASQSATNDRAGAKSQLSGLIVSGLIFLTAAFLMPLFTNLADAVLGAIVISAVLGFFNIPALRRIFRLRRDEFWLAMVALFGVLILGVLPGLLLAVFLSFGVLLVRASQPKLHELGWLADKDAFANIEREPEAQRIPQLLIVRLGAPMFADNAQAARNLIRDKVRAQTPPPRVVIFDLETTPNLDVESVDKLEQMHRELGEENIQLWLARLHDAAADMAMRSELVETLGKDRFFFSVDDAVDAFKVQIEQERVVEVAQAPSSTERS